MRKIYTLLGILGCFSLSSAFDLKLNVEGGITLYGIYTDNKTQGDKKLRYDVGSALLKISEQGKGIGFNLIGGAYSLPVVGIALLKSSDYTDLFSPIPVAYVEVSPTKTFSMQIGKLPTLVGYESAFTYSNNYIQRGLVWNMQPVINNGVRLSYNSQFFFAKFGINDGFYTLSTSHPKPALEFSFGLTPNKDSSISLNLLIPDKDTKPNKTANPANKRELNLTVTYNWDKFSTGLDALYVEAPKSVSAGVPERATAEGVALHLSYDIKPFKLSGRVEYAKDKRDIGNIDLVGLGDGNRGWTFTLTPTYTKGPLLLRGEVSQVIAQKPFTLNAKKHQTRFGIEVGFVF